MSSLDLWSGRLFPNSVLDVTCQPMARTLEKAMVCI
ncbi:unnamed protein product [Knipowitschia caucasica]